MWHIWHIDILTVPCLNQYTYSITYLLSHCDAASGSLTLLAFLKRLRLQKCSGSLQECCNCGAVFALGLYFAQRYQAAQLLSPSLPFVGSQTHWLWCSRGTQGGWTFIEAFLDVFFLVNWESANDYAKTSPATPAYAPTSTNFFETFNAWKTWKMADLDIFALGKTFHVEGFPKSELYPGQPSSTSSMHWRTHKNPSRPTSIFSVLGKHSKRLSVSEVGRWRILLKKISSWSKSSFCIPTRTCRLGWGFLADPGWGTLPVPKKPNKSRVHHNTNHANHANHTNHTKTNHIHPTHPAIAIECWIPSIPSITSNPSCIDGMIQRTIVAV